MNIAVYGQHLAEVEFYGTKKEIKRTKKFLKQHTLSLIILNERIKVDYASDTALVVNDFTDRQINYLKTQAYILVEFKGKNFCSYSLLPNAFSSWYYKSIRSLVIYDATKCTIFVRKKRKRYVLSFTYFENGMSFSTPLSLIPCSEYKGKYDNGMP
jgi:predicted ATP-dependent endonuclease of OLD family